VTFKPDPLIFKSTVEFDFDKLADRVDELAYLNAGLTIHMTDERTKAARINSIAVKTNSELVDSDVDNSSTKKNKKITIINDEDENETVEEDPIRKVTFRHDGGIKELVTVLCEGKTILHSDVDVIVLKQEKKGVDVEVALRWWSL
jgi:DNA gyrase subunit B